MTGDIGAWLDQAVADGRLRRVDRAFARFLATLDVNGDPRVLMAAALASREAPFAPDPLLAGGVDP